MKKLHSNWFWGALIGVLLVISLVASYFTLRQAANVGVAYVYQDGVLLRGIDLSAVSAPYEFTVDGAHGQNTIRVEPNRICVVAADCPDKTCVHQGWIANSLLPAVCLPNKLVIRISGAGGAAYDAVTR